MKMVDMTPTWETAVQIHSTALENPDADPRAKEGARDEMIRMARYAVNIHCMALDNPDAGPRTKGDARAELLRLAQCVDKLHRTYWPDKK